jgi:hypothetical protein
VKRQYTLSFSTVLATVIIVLGSAVKDVPAVDDLTIDEINRIRLISTYSILYKIHLIVLIYGLNLINALIFDSCTVFPVGWLFAALITLIMEKATNPGRTSTVVNDRKRSNTQISDRLMVVFNCVRHNKTRP